MYTNKRTDDSFLPINLPALVRRPRQSLRDGGQDSTSSCPGPEDFAWTLPGQSCPGLLCKTSPVLLHKTSPVLLRKTLPWTLPVLLRKTSPWTSPVLLRKTSPGTSPVLLRKALSRTAAQYSACTSPVLLRKTSPCTLPVLLRKTLPGTSPLLLRKALPAPRLDCCARPCLDCYTKLHLDSLAWNPDNMTQNCWISNYIM